MGRGLDKGHRIEMISTSGGTGTRDGLDQHEESMFLLYRMNDDGGTPTSVREGTLPAGKSAGYHREKAGTQITHKSI